MVNPIKEKKIRKYEEEIKRMTMEKSSKPSLNKDFTAQSVSPKVCPRNHSISRQLTEDGYCKDCGGYPLREDKPS